MFSNLWGRQLLTDAAIFSDLPAGKQPEILMQDFRMRPLVPQYRGNTAFFPPEALAKLLERPGMYYVRIRGGAKTDREGMVVGW